MKWFRRILITFLIIGVVGLLSLFIINWQVKSYSANKIFHNIKEVPKHESSRIGIVYGAAVYRNGKLSHALYDRVFTAVNLYKAGKVQKLLMSGDNSRKTYDEPTAMKEAAIKMGVLEKDIVLDFAGRRTYDTCYRAKEIFEIKRAILITQEFHLPRATYLCENMGIDTIGVAADRRDYLDERSWAVREFLAVVSAWLEMNFVPFKPIGGEKEPIRQ